MGAGQGLVEMVMRVDETGNDNMIGGVEYRIMHRRFTVLNKLRNPAIFDDDAASRVVRQNGKRAGDPEPHFQSPRPG